MWRFLRFIHMWRNFRFLHTADVQKYEISQHVACVWCQNVNTYAKFKLFCNKISFLQFTQFYRETVVSWFTHFCVEKNLSKNCISGEKMTNMRSGWLPSEGRNRNWQISPTATAAGRCHNQVFAFTLEFQNSKWFPFKCWIEAVWKIQL